MNKRLTDNIYTGIQPVREYPGCLVIGDGAEGIIDYAVCMHKMERGRQMDLLLIKGQVTEHHIHQLAQRIADFHKSANIVYEKDYLDIQKKFADLNEEKYFLQNALDEDCAAMIIHAINVSDRFNEANKDLLLERLKAGYFRDCHGDLHSGNIFLLETPQAFDCIEFNDDYRQIDVLNEIAFLCMDLDAFGRKDLSDLFLDHYDKLFPTIKTAQDRKLFIYYKSYRANIRAKVNSLRARSAMNELEKNAALAEIKKYLRLMNDYLKML